MNLFYRGLAAGAALGLVALAAGPGDLSAQPKKDDKTKVDPKKVDPKKVDPKPVERKLDEQGSFVTADGVTIWRWWYSAGKASADAVMMFPAPGNKVTDQMRAMAKALQQKGFSVLVFDWRGTGENAPGGKGGGVDRNKFEKDPFNSVHMRTIPAGGLTGSGFKAAGSRTPCTTT